MIEQEICTSRRIRHTPYTERAVRHGATGFTVVNHMLLPKAYGSSVSESYSHLRDRVQVWDVACQRQVEISGPDALRLVQLMTSRDVALSRIGGCMYLPLIDGNAGLINDPVLLRLDVDRFWVSIADSDVLLFALGLAHGMGLDVRVNEPDVSPLAVQGPKAEDVAAALFGESIRQLGFFAFDRFEFNGTRQLVARSGFSSQDGFEIYLCGGELGPSLWDSVLEAGRPFDIAPGCPNLIDRIESGLISYGNEVTRENNPLEAGLGKYCSFKSDVHYLGKSALEEVAKSGARRVVKGIAFDGGPCPPCVRPWPILTGDTGRQTVGQITSAAYSPRLGKNVALAMIEREFWNCREPVLIVAGDETVRSGQIVELPFD